MTLIKLREEAAALGYELVKKRPKEKFLPCLCGGNRRQLSYYPNKVDGLKHVYICKRCGHMGPFGENPTDAKRKWNEMIRGMSYEDR